ncbi:oligopeptide transport system substrate-binding protein [Melghirimyces profundicolus]|uniref:Oligopeptide transport system substrate-binding protein n=1 Tax=Melghirimyces profundicolus TaxID=1242148 RepID=A0A2T6BSP9_9BACL|nr:peptide ABC transporter substrate-binding protein [Melghirimyces profundicolus]PTX59121.1 oligopeptide transport system substrate-binding protein [Melghirimyces profundicolus]
MGKKWNMALSLLLVVSMVLTACGGVQQGAGGKDKQELNWVITAEPPGLDSAITTDTVSFQILNNITEGLYRLNKDNEPEPAIAKDVEISDDKKTYTFKLRDAKWSDGKPVTAHDFEFAWKRALDPKNKSQYAYILFPIQGAQEYNEGKGDQEDVAVKAVDDKTLKVELKDPIPYFLMMTSFATYRPQREDIVEKYGKDFAEDPDKMVYNGPFKLTQWQHNKSLKLEKNEKYWDKDKVKLDTINFTKSDEVSTQVNLYNTGKLDFVENLDASFVDKFKGKEDVKVFNETTTFYLQFNTNDQFFANEKIRKAFTMALDRSIMTDKISKTGSKPAQGLVPPNVEVDGKSFRELSGKYLKEDPKEAKKLLEEGMKEEGIKKVPKVELLGYDRDTAKKDQEYMQQTFKEVLGVDVDIQILPFKQKLEREDAGKFQISYAGWGADYNDPMTFLDLWVTGNAFNRGDWSNKEYDKLIKKAQSNPDFEERAKQLAKAEKILMEEQAIAPLYHRARMQLQKPYVKNVWRHPFGADYTFKEAYIEGKQ